MQLITALQPPHNVADFADLAYARSRITIFNINATFRLRALGGVIVVVRNIAGPVFDEVILRIVSRLGNALSRRRQKLRSLRRRHVEVNRFEKPAASEAVA